eukprot:1159502-Pelagomonas_calceolata.AAC.6
MSAATGPRLGGEVRQEHKKEVEREERLWKDSTHNGRGHTSYCVQKSYKLSCEEASGRGQAW